MAEQVTPGVLCLAQCPISIAEPPGTDAKRPCIVLLHERYGLVQHTRDLASRLAQSGYVVAAPDLFHDAPDQEALHRGEIKIPSDDVAVLTQLESVVARLTDHPRADVTRLAMIGFCQTARFPLVYDAVYGLRACASFYGAAQDREWESHDRFPVPLAERVERGRAPVFGVFGERDHAISRTHVVRLRDALERANRSYSITLYPDAPHGFLNDTMPGRHRKESAAHAWRELLVFFARAFDDQAASAAIEWRFSATTSVDYDFTKNVRME